MIFWALYSICRRIKTILRRYQKIFVTCLDYVSEYNTTYLILRIDSRCSQALSYLELQTKWTRPSKFNCKRLILSGIEKKHLVISALVANINRIQGYYSPELYNYKINRMFPSKVDCFDYKSSKQISLIVASYRLFSFILKFTLGLPNSST